MKIIIVIIFGIIILSTGVIIAFKNLNNETLLQIPVLSNILPQNITSISKNNGDYNITTISRINGVSISLKDTEGIINFIKKIAVYDHNFVESSEAKGNTSGQPVKTVNLILVAGTQPKNRFSYPDGRVYTSSFAMYKPGEVDVHIHIDDGIIESEDNNDLADRIEGQFMLTLYNLSHPVKNLTEYNTRQEKVFSEIRELNLDFISVDK